jgi:hypothetical protein
MLKIAEIDIQKSFSSVLVVSQGSRKAQEKNKWKHKAKKENGKEKA